MDCHLHHVHLLASDLDKSIEFYRKYFDGEVKFDMVMGGIRHVGMNIGKGHLHFYEMPPKGPNCGPIHHVGIQTDDLQKLVERLKDGGVEFNPKINDLATLRFVFVPAPDGVMLELFEVPKEHMPEKFRNYYY